MCDKAVWLPDIVSVDGEPFQIFQMLYRIFCRDFKDSQCIFRTYPVWYDRRILDDKYEEGFWHLIAREDRITGERLFDPRRAERLPWCAPSIKNSYDPIIKVWNYLEAKEKVHTYIWLENFDYVIILRRREQRGGLIYFLVTAFHVDGTRKRNQLKKKFEKREL